MECLTCLHLEADGLKRGMGYQLASFARVEAMPHLQQMTFVCTEDEFPGALLVLADRMGKEGRLKKCQIEDESGVYAG